MNSTHTFNIPIRKIDEEKQFVFGWANVSMTEDGAMVTDSQGDQIDIEDLELAAYEFNLSFRKAGINHEGDAIGEAIESFVVTPEKLEIMGLAKDALPFGWWLGFHVESATDFAKVKSRELSMFSIHGTAIREEVAGGN